jgi:hypothetical protein
MTIMANCGCYIPQRQTCELRGFPNCCYFAIQIRATIQGNCGLHKSIEEWQKCKACERLSVAFLKARA